LGRGSGPPRSASTGRAEPLERAASITAAASSAGVGRSLTATAGAVSQRPRQETSRMWTSGSSPKRSRSSAIVRSLPCSQQDRSWQQASSTLGGGSVRKCG
jgi:hypothetical protein